MSEQISIVERERKVRAWGKVVEEYRHKANMKRQEVARRKEYEERSFLQRVGFIGWAAMILGVLGIIVLIKWFMDFNTLGGAGFLGGVVAFFCIPFGGSAMISANGEKKYEEEAKLRTDVTKDTLEGDIYLIAKEELRIAEVELAAARQGQEPDPDAIKLNIPFMNQVPRLCKNCVYAKNAEFSDGDLDCQKRRTKVGRSNICDYFEDRRVVTAYMEAQTAFKKFKELDESGFH